MNNETDYTALSQLAGLFKAKALIEQQIAEVTKSLQPPAKERPTPEQPKGADSLPALNVEEFEEPSTGGLKLTDQQRMVLDYAVSKGGIMTLKEFKKDNPGLGKAYYSAGIYSTLKGLIETKRVMRRMPDGAYKVTATGLRVSSHAGPTQ